MTTAAFDNPGAGLERRYLSQPVMSCEEAARAKGVELERELKSLLLRTSRGRVLVHVRGNRHLSLRMVKRSLGGEQAQLASRAELASLQLAPGTIHPFAPTLWRLPQLVTREILRLEWVTTNAGEANTYVVFEPHMLLAAPQVLVGAFET